MHIFLLFKVWPKSLSAALLPVEGEWLESSGLYFCAYFEALILELQKQIDEVHFTVRQKVFSVPVGRVASHEVYEVTVGGQLTAGHI